MPKGSLILAAVLLLDSGVAAARVSLAPYPPAGRAALLRSLDPNLLPVRAERMRVDDAQVVTLRGAAAAPLVLVPVTYTLAPGGLAWCGLYVLDRGTAGRVRFLPTFNRVPDTYGQCDSLAALGLEDATRPHPRILLVYNAFEPSGHAWQQPLVLTWRRATRAYAVAPEMPDQGAGMDPDRPDPGSPRWSVARVRQWLRRR